MLSPPTSWWPCSPPSPSTGSDKYRLHSRADEDSKNLVPKRDVILAVLIQHLLQAAIAFAVFKIKRQDDDRRRAVGGAGAMTTPPAAIIAVPCQFLVAMAIFDTWQYFWHRLMHSNAFLYRHVHSWHHRVLAQYNHPLESLVLDTAGGAVALAASGMSPMTSAWFFSFATLKAVDDHSGLLLPGNPLHILFRNNTAYHDVHHQLRGTRCNYSQPFFVAWDRIMGTYVPYAVVRASHGGLEAVPAAKKKTPSP